MIGIQVHFPEEDLNQLRRLAEEEGVSVSELVRRGVRQLLSTARPQSRAEVARRALGAAGRFRSGKADLARRHDDYLAEDLRR
jgi:Arc/MetJ-type ribon-helix-helix transcriptional regulator